MFAAVSVFAPILVFIAVFAAAVLVDCAAFGEGFVALAAAAASTGADAPAATAGAAAIRTGVAAVGLADALESKLPLDEMPAMIRRRYDAPR
ncbi:hypothetical protein K438DRAFT_1832838, partial [Mycena galopus ATCC 62051]